MVLDQRRAVPGATVIGKALMVLSVMRHLVSVPVNQGLEVESVTVACQDTLILGRLDAKVGNWCKRWICIKISRKVP